MRTKIDFKNHIFDVLCAITAGVIVGTAYHFFQNSNGFAPGGVGGLATITHHLLKNRVSWSLLMIAFNLPIFILVSAFINKKLGAILSLYMVVQSFIPRLYEAIGWLPYSLANNREDFNIVFACIATGVISGFGFSLMLMHGKSITEQLQSYFDSYKMMRAERFIVYFQSYSNTYAKIDVLRGKYLEAMNFSDKIVAIQIATRPDCISVEIVDLLSNLSKIKPIIVELGLQTSNSKSATMLNLKYTKEDFSNAVNMLNNAGIEVVCHIMVGLPSETHADIQNTVRFINSLPIKGIKIHSTYVTNNSGLLDLYNTGSYSPLCFVEYLRELEYILTHLRKDIIIHRISGDPPKETFVAPDWTLYKKRVLNGISKLMKEKNLLQGCYFKQTKTPT